MARSSKRRSSKRTGSAWEDAIRQVVDEWQPPPKEKKLSFAEWKATLVAIREAVAFDLRNPVGFSEYLLALYGNLPDDWKWYEVAV